MQNNYNQKYNDDDILAQYFAGQSDLQPEEIALRRKQAQVDALRERGMESQEGKMVGNTYVVPSFTQYAAQLANAYMGRKGQEGVDVKEKELGTRRGAALRGAGATIRERQAAANNSALLAPGENMSLTPKEANRRRLKEMLSGGRGY